jgi:cyclopropane-fatty-acyl-phospholipid synthase
MFEAVGLRHYDDYFGAIERLLTPDGVMAMQTITVSDQWFPRYHGSPDWIEAYIFPGGELAAIGEILGSVARATSMSLYAAENFGTHYARTLRLWRRRFQAQLPKVRALGFDERFVRMWDFYLATCEATFRERHTGVFQLVLTKNGTRRRLFNEPWIETALEGRMAGSAA